MLALRTEYELDDTLAFGDPMRGSLCVLAESGRDFEWEEAPEDELFRRRAGASRPVRFNGHLWFGQEAPPIRASDRIAGVLDRDERLLFVLTDVSSVFERFRNPKVRRTMAKLVTVEQAARVAGIPSEVLLEKLNLAAAAPGDASRG